MSTLSKLGLLALSLLIVFLIGFIDHITQEDISIYVFYSVPIFLSTWFLGVNAGIPLALFAALTWYAVDLLEQNPSSLLPYGNVFMRLTFFVGTSLMLGALKVTLEREKDMAHRDFLTGVANRRTFFEAGQMEISRADRYDRVFTVAFIDLDDFKEVNDRFGHNAGDRLLRFVGQALRKNTRSSDLVARLGGDEFVVLLTETGEEAGLAVLQKLQTQLCEIMNEHRWDVTFSIGAITYLSPPKSVDEMLANADHLMYAAKKTGRNLIRHETKNIVAAS